MKKAKALSSEPEYLTPEELSKRYKGRISIRTLANWRTQNNGSGPPYVKIGGRVLYPFAELLKWEKKRMVAKMLLAVVGVI